jgi:uncharacterized membrane protein
MSFWKSFGLGIFAALCLLGEITGSAHAQCEYACAIEWSGSGTFRVLGNLPGSDFSVAQGINDAGQAVGVSNGSGIGVVATEWSSSGKVINLGGLPGGEPISINDAGQAAGLSSVGSTVVATEWSGIGGSVINLGAYQAPRIALLMVSITPGIWWGTA